MSFGRHWKEPHSAFSATTLRTIMNPPFYEQLYKTTNSHDTKHTETRVWVNREPTTGNKRINYTSSAFRPGPLTLARLVDFPTPLTPQKVTTKGRRWFCASMTSLRMSTLRLGCRICTNESCRASFTVEATATHTHTHKTSQLRPESCIHTAIH